jgi:membrane peptidoglycan carboxypeptidase
VAEVKHDWVPLEQISRELQLAVIAAEDQRFAEHNGFDMDAISSALRHNQQSGRVRVPAPSASRPPRTSSCGAIAASCARG